MRLLDLFCGAGGAAMGYHRAGFDDIVGIDNVPQPNYPYMFIQADAVAFMDAMLDGREDIAYDLIHASPPCQRWSPSAHYDHPDLVTPTRELLTLIGRPYVIENVPQAPIRRDLQLCGSMFGLAIRRHRDFELLDVPLILVPACNHKAWPRGRPVLVAGHAGGSETNSHHQPYRDLADAQELMGMPWTTRVEEVTEAIPPAYTEYIGRAFLEQFA